jgi:hypothetical protein
MSDIMVCDGGCFAGVRDGKTCGLCRGTGIMRKTIIKLGDGAIEMWCPSNLTQEEAQKEFDEGIAILMNKFGLTD